MSAVLAEIGYSMRSAEDGFSALDEIRQQVPDILLSDLNMPGMSGFELLSVVRRRFPKIRTIAMSGSFTGDEVPSGVAADAFYQKGSSIGALLQIIGTLDHIERRADLAQGVTDPIWIQRSGLNGPEAPYMTMVCPECLRSTPRAAGSLICQMDETICTHCRRPIRYAVVESTVRQPLEMFRKTHGGAREMPESAE